MKLDNKQLAAFAFAILVTLIILISNPAAWLQQSIGNWGYLGIFAIMLINNATILLPVPGLLAVLAMAKGGAYSFLLIGIAGGIGAAFGELTGYLFGYGTLAFVQEDKYKIYKRTQKWMDKNGFLTVLVFAAIPNPLFDIAGIAAGSTKYQWWKFLLACAIGQVIKVTALAYLGYSLL